MAARSTAYTIFYRSINGILFESHLGHGHMSEFLSVCCPVEAERLCDGPIPHPKSATKYLSTFQNPEKGKTLGRIL
jgi:hypothetical protein